MNLTLYTDLMFERELQTVLEQELTDDEREQVENQLIQNFCNAVNKVEDLLKFTNNLQAYQDQCSKEEERIYNKRIQAESLEAKIKQGIKNYMLAKGLDKIKAGTYDLSLQTSSSIELDDMSQVDPQYKRVVVKEDLDRIKIKADMKAGAVEEKGFHVEQHKNLQIK